MDEPFQHNPEYQAEQAVFTSLPNGPVQGYHLVARSAGIDDALAQQLVRWGPSHAALCEERAAAESVNFHPLSEGRWVLSRTLCGGPEYSGRGGFQLITCMAVLSGLQWEAYGFHAVSLYRRARSEGLFQLPTRLPDRLPPLRLPPPALFFPAEGKPSFAEREERSGTPFCEQLLLEIRRHLQQQQRLVVVLNGLDPLDFLERFLAELSPLQRKTFSFTTGLKPSAHRPFQLHLLPAAFPELRHTVERLNLHLICI